MSKKLLIATLGTSPAVITEAIDLLQEQDARPDGVIVFMTQDADVQDSFTLLTQHLPSHDQITWIDPVPIAAYTDITNSRSAVEFMQEACRILKAYRDSGYRLFVSIAGGRKAMSSLLALAVQFYGAERLFHIWVPPWIEAEGEIAELRRLPSEQVVERLHPRLTGVPDSDRPRMVDLPFIGLFPLMGDILDVLKGQMPPSRNLRQILVANGLLAKDGAPTPLGSRVAAILESVESLPPARQGDCKIHIGQHHYQDRLHSFSKDLSGRFPFVTEIQSDEWRQGTEQVKAEPPNVLVVGTRLSTDFLFRLRLTTTAALPGQLEAARREVEQYLQRRQ